MLTIGYATLYNNHSTLPTMCIGFLPIFLFVKKSILESAIICLIQERFKGHEINYNTRLRIQHEITSNVLKLNISHLTSLEKVPICN